jgi:hypothetical protein
MATGDVDPYSAVGPRVPQPPSDKKWRTRLLILGAVAVLGALLVGAAGVVAMDSYRNGFEPFCISDEVVAAVQQEVEALVPAGATNVLTAVSDCDDSRTVSTQFTDPTATSEALSAAALDRGWESTARTGCFQKEIDGRAFYLEVGTVSADNPTSAGNPMLAVTPGYCRT